MRPAWLAQAPWRPVTLPPPVRSPERTLEVVTSLHLDDPDCPYAPTVENGVRKTFCNAVAADFTAALGCPIPRVGYMGGVLREWQVLEMRTWLCGEGVASHGWERVTAHVAQAMADVGQVAIALWQGRTAEHGHIAPVIPSGGRPGPRIAQAGARCFSDGLVTAGFGDLPVEYFAHP